MGFTLSDRVPATIRALGASWFLLTGMAFAQQAPKGLLPLQPNAVQGPGDAKRQQQEQRAETGKQQTASPIELKTFFQQIVGTKEDEVVQESEIEDILNRFEYQYRVLIPDRDVLMTSSLTTKQLIESLKSRLEHTPDGDNNLPQAAIPINGGRKENWESLKPFQRRDMLNNPKKMLDGVLSVPGVRGGAGDFYNSDGSLNVGAGSGYPKTSVMDVVGRAMLDIRPDIGDPAKNDPLSRVRASSAPITKGDYELIKARFLQMPSKEAYRALELPERDLTAGTSATDRFDDDWFKLRVAVFRRYQEAATQQYSNGRSRFDAQGRELHPNGKRKFDDAGRPVYSNGRRKFDEGGKPIHSNGIPKFSANGTPLYANGQPKKSDSGRNLFRGGEKKTNDRGVPLYENGQPRVAQNSSAGSVRQRLPGQEARDNTINQIGVPTSPAGQRQVGDDGRVLYENGRPKVNDEGSPLYKNQQKRIAPNGQEQFDNARNMESARGQALTSTGSEIAGTFGFQGRPSGVFPLASIQWAAFQKSAAGQITVKLEKGQEELTIPVEGAFVGASVEAMTANVAKIPLGSRVRLVWIEPTKFVDGQSVGSAGKPRLLALFTTSATALQKSESADVPTVRVVSGIVSSVAADVLTIKDRAAGQMQEIGLSGASVQRTSAGKVLPIPSLALGLGRPVTIIARTTATLKNGKVVGETSLEAIAVWQDGP